MTKILNLRVNESEEQNYGGRVKQQRTKFRAKHEAAKSLNAARKNKKPKDRSSIRNLFV